MCTVVKLTRRLYPQHSLSLSTEILVQILSVLQRSFNLPVQKLTHILSLASMHHQNSSIVLAPVALSIGLSHDPHRALEKMKEGVNDLPGEVPGFLQILDEIAKVHVTISGMYRDGGVIRTLLMRT